MVAAVIILCREVLVSGLREYLMELRVALPVSTLAKYKTTIQMVAIGFLLSDQAGETLISGAHVIGLGLLWLAAILTLITGYDYVRQGIKHAEWSDK
jgi:phosphatidylglycerophosphate synthase